MSRRLRVCACSNSASTEPACTEQKTSAVVVPLRSSSSQKTRAVVARHCRVGEGLLGDEGVLVEPVEQLLALRADDAGLHVVDMRVDEARRDQAARMVGQVGVRRQLRLSWRA